MLDRRSVAATDLTTHLSHAANAARCALEAVRPECDELLKLIQRYDRAVQSAAVRVPGAAPALARAAVASFATHYDELRQTLDRFVDHTATTLADAYLDLERNAPYVTMMPFGRTRAGKSTTMEAFTAGNGESIGVGHQHTTRDIRAYYFPTDAHESGRPALRIVDTPGIEGFRGSHLAAMAEEFVERADHILFLLTDDKASATELEQFGSIRTQGKSVSVLLNVKAADEDLDLLVESPEHVFKPAALAEHHQRISD